MHPPFRTQPQPSSCSPLKAQFLLQEKNVGSDMLEGKVGRIYLPNQMIDTMPQHKMKVRATSRALGSFPKSYRDFEA